MYIDFNKESKNKSPKFKVGDHVRISKISQFGKKPIFQIGLKNFL